MRSLNFIADINKHIKITKAEAWERLSKQQAVYVKTKRGLYSFSQNINNITIKTTVYALPHIKDLGETFIDRIVKVQNIEWYK